MHPRRVRHDVPAAPEAGLIVSIHAPAWGATLPICPKEDESGCFNPRTRVGCDTVANESPFWLMKCFNPRTRVGCDAVLMPMALAAIWFQSTHPRGVRQELTGMAGNEQAVSIHAPAWGATHHDVAFRRCVQVSIHAPAWGATLHGLKKGHSLLLFQSTHPRGVRRPERIAQDVACYVSIHAPAWGATSLLSSRTSRYRCFNPRTRVGCDTR